MSSTKTSLVNVCWLVRDVDIFKGFSDSDWDPRPMLQNTQEIRKIDYNGYCEAVTTEWINYIKEYLNDTCSYDTGKVVDRIDLIQVCHTKNPALRQDQGYFRLVINRKEVLDFIFRESDNYRQYLSMMYENERGFLSMAPSSPQQAEKLDQFRWDLYFDFYVRSHIDITEMTEYMHKVSREVFMKYYLEAPARNTENQ